MIEAYNDLDSFNNFFANKKWAKLSHSDTAAALLRDYNMLMNGEVGHLHPTEYKRAVDFAKYINKNFKGESQSIPSGRINSLDDMLDEQGTYRIWNSLDESEEI